MVALLDWEQMRPHAELQFSVQLCSAHALGIKLRPLQWKLIFAANIFMMASSWDLGLRVASGCQQCSMLAICQGRLATCIEALMLSSEDEQCL